MFNSTMAIKHAFAYQKSSFSFLKKYDYQCYLYSFDIYMEIFRLNGRDFFYFIICCVFFFIYIFYEEMQ